MAARVAKDASGMSISGLCCVYQELRILGADGEGIPLRRAELQVDVAARWLIRDSYTGRVFW